MLVHSSTNILTLSNTQAKELAGRFVTIGGTTYYSKNYDPGSPASPRGVPGRRERPIRC